MQVAERMRAGDVIYAGIWDHKPPGIYLVLVAGQSLLPFLSAWAVSWILSVAATAATGWTVLTICRGLGTTRGASLVAGAICVVVMGEFLLSLGGGLTEPVAALPLAFALLATLAAFPPSVRAAHWASVRCWASASCSPSRRPRASPRWVRWSGCGAAAPWSRWLAPSLASRSCWWRRARGWA